jgi:hypothetical protein
MEAVATQKLQELENGGGSSDKSQEDGEEAEYLSEDFYKSKIMTSQYVFDALLPRTRTLRQQMLTPIDSIMQMDKDHFSFDHAQ